MQRTSKTHIFIPFFPRNSCHLWDKPQMTINRTHALCILDNYGYRHTLRICKTYFSFPWQKWLRERASVLRYTYTACLVSIHPMFVACPTHQSPWFDYSHLTYVLLSITLSAATFHKAAALNFCHFGPTLSFQDAYTKSYEIPIL
jgi:hypothetical protein